MTYTPRRWADDAEELGRELVEHGRRIREALDAAGFPDGRIVRQLDGSLVGESQSLRVSLSRALEAQTRADGVAELLAGLEVESIDELALLVRHAREGVWLQEVEPHLVRAVTVERGLEILQAAGATVILRGQGIELELEVDSVTKRTL